MNTFCTTSTGSHLFKAFALAHSIHAFGFTLHVLVVDAFDPSKILVPENVILHQVSDITDDKGKRLISKYRHKQDKLRWSLKPVFIKHLLAAFDKVIYTDNDIFFYSDCSFLFNKLDAHKVVLTPHFYNSDPLKKQNWFEANFRVGLYNAGFFAARKDAVPLLDWWADCCSYNIKKSFTRGLFDDQKYLDLMPVVFDDVHVIKHKGCNMAGWNYQNYALTRNDEQAYMNGDKLVFIHFAELSMIAFSVENNFFSPEYRLYIDALKKNDPAFRFKRRLWNSYTIISYLNYLWWKMVRVFEAG